MMWEIVAGEVIEKLLSKRTGGIRHSAAKDVSVLSKAGRAIQIHFAVSILALVSCFLKGNQKLPRSR